VICIHGDSHKHRIDKPFKNTSGKTYENFTRLEVFGAPVVAGVAVEVNPNSTTVFRFERYDAAKAK